MAKEREDDVIVICEDDHFFTENYSSGLLFKEIQEAYMQGAELLSGGIGGFGQAVPVGYHRYWGRLVLEYSIYCNLFICI